MKNFFENLKNLLKKELSILWIFSVVLGLALIALDLKNKLPLGMGDFVFISILAFCIALYRPRWAFYLFVSLVPLENIILASGFLPIQLRPYQYIGVILTVAIIILWLFKRLNFKLLKPVWVDWLVFSLVPFSFLSLTNSQDRGISLKNNLILFSFVVLYFLGRNFMRTRRHLIETTFFFIASNIVVLGYGFFQVFADKFLPYRQADGASTFEAMFGRPNSTFTEADWLGIFLCFSVAVFFVILRNIAMRRSHVAQDNAGLLPAVPAGNRNARNESIAKIFLYILLFLNLTLLILTLSRSAWIGGMAIIFFFLLFTLYRKKENIVVFTPRDFAISFLTILIISAISFAAIQIGKLSKFDILDRARSTATSEQKITIACESNSNIPPVVSDTGDLEFFGCQHINLENIEYYKAQGKYVTTIFRKDPNVMTRGQIYRKSFEIIKTHPILGVGFGTITQTLGMDERGAGLNESNIFLQIWEGRIYF